MTAEKRADIIRNMETIRDLYSPEDISRLQRKIKREWVWVLGGAGLTLALCVALCCRTTTANWRQMELAVIAVSTLGGWFTIYRRLFGLAESRHELQHAEYLRNEPRTQLRGRLGVTKEKLRIKNSIRIRILTLEDGGQIRRLKVNENRVKALKEWDGKLVTVSLAGGYVAGIGGSDAGT